MGDHLRSHPLVVPGERPADGRPPELGPLVPFWLDCSVRVSVQKTNRQTKFQEKDNGLFITKGVGQTVQESWAGE